LQGTVGPEVGSVVQGGYRAGGGHEEGEDLALLIVVERGGNEGFAWSAIG